MARLYPCLIVPILLGAATAARADFIVYQQPSDFPAMGAFGGFASQNDTAVGGIGNFATAYDNFSIKATVPITDATWQGGYFGPPNPGPITGFTLTFWKDNGGQPGTALLSEHINGNANQSPRGFDPGLGGGGQVFNYSTNLPTPFLAQANTPYWLSIVPDLDFSDDPSIGQWAWHTGTGGDGKMVQDYLGQRFTFNEDLAFSLSSPQAVVPEPASLAAWGLVGLGGVAYRWYRRRRAGAR
jgi:hypothetical protein